MWDEKQNRDTQNHAKRMHIPQQGFLAALRADDPPGVKHRSKLYQECSQMYGRTTRVVHLRRGNDPNMHNQYGIPQL